MCSLIAVRHGERLDKADEALWKSIVAEANLTGPSALYFSQDPPLTATGINQAQEMARNVLTEISRIQKPVHIYSSRLLRSVGTAVEIAKLTNSPVFLSTGVSMVIPEVLRANGRFVFKSVSELTTKFPGVTFIDCDEAGPNSISSSSWSKAFKTITNHDDVLNIIVGHGETLKSLVGSKVQTPYCCYGSFHRKPPGRSQPYSTSTRNSSNAPAVGEGFVLIGIKDHSGRTVPSSRR